MSISSSEYVFVSGKVQDAVGHSKRRVVRKNVRDLSPTERRSLVLAMDRLQKDSSTNGYQALAAFHSIPPLCPYPEATKRYACCIHGQATFPQWHRLHLVQAEDALRRRGAVVGIPYWDNVVANEWVFLLIHQYCLGHLCVCLFPTTTLLDRKRMCSHV